MNVVAPMITSRKNEHVISTAALHEKKYRKERECFLVEGEKLVLEAAAFGLPICALFLSESKNAAFLARLSPLFSKPPYDAVPIYILSDDCFLKISSEKSPQGVIAVIKYLDFFKRKTIIYKEDILSFAGDRTVMLYAIQDPGNLGAVIRSAVAFGVESILLSADCADLYSTKTIRAAMGSLFHVRTCVIEDVPSAIRALQQCGRGVFAAELRDGAMPFSVASLSRQDCILIGNEGHGIPPAISRLCNGSLYLPISPNAESLNASVAAAIFLWEQSKLTT